MLCDQLVLCVPLTRLLLFNSLSAWVHLPWWSKGRNRVEGRLRCFNRSTLIALRPLRKVPKTSECDDSVVRHYLRVECICFRSKCPLLWNARSLAQKRSFGPFTKNAQENILASVKDQSYQLKVYCQKVDSTKRESVAKDNTHPTPKPQQKKNYQKNDLSRTPSDSPMRLSAVSVGVPAQLPASAHLSASSASCQCCSREISTSKVSLSFIGARGAPLAGLKPVDGLLTAKIDASRLRDWTALNLSFR
jgi:hypothetical protein